MTTGYGTKRRPFQYNVTFYTEVNFLKSKMGHVGYVMGPLLESGLGHIELRVNGKKVACRLAEATFDITATESLAYIALVSTGVSLLF